MYKTYLKHSPWGLSTLTTAFLAANFGGSLTGPCPVKNGIFRYWQTSHSRWETTLREKPLPRETKSSRRAAYSSSKPLIKSSLSGAALTHNLPSCDEDERVEVGEPISVDYSFLKYRSMQNT